MPEIRSMRVHRLMTDLAGFKSSFTNSAEGMEAYPESAILAQGAIKERNNMLQEARNFQEALRQRIKEIKSETAPS